MRAGEHSIDVAPPRASRLAAGAALALSIVLVATVYAFVLTAGFSPKNVPSQRYHHLLAEAFLAGQLHLRQAPQRELLEQADPYDFKTSKHLWRLWDASLYDGKYYFYWGPVPALLIAGVEVAAGGDTIVTDRHVVAAAVLGRVVVGAMLLVLVARALFPGLGPWMPAAAVVLFGLATPYPYGLGRPGVYEAAIESGQFFLLLGMLAAFVAVSRASGTRPQAAWLVGAGCAWAAALGSRVSLLFAVAALVPLTALFALRPQERSVRAFIVRVSIIGAPVALVLLALGAYNAARFGSFADFGTSYMLTGRRYDPDRAFFLPNLHAYLLRPFVPSCRFPFVEAPFFAHTLTPRWLASAPGYVPKEPVVGLLVAMPFVVFAAAAVGAAIPKLVRYGRSFAGTRAPGAALGDDAADATARVPANAHDPAAADGTYAWLISACVAIVCLAGLPSLGVWFPTMRYLADVVSAALILAVVGYWTLWERARAQRRRSAAAWLGAAAFVLGVYTVTIGLLLGMQGGYYGVFRNHNPALQRTLADALSLCDEPVRPQKAKKPPPPKPPVRGG